jgi:hypothetical protein
MTRRRGSRASAATWLAFYSSASSSSGHSAARASPRRTSRPASSGRYCTRGRPVLEHRARRRVGRHLRVAAGRRGHAPSPDRLRRGLRHGEHLVGAERHRRLDLVRHAPWRFSAGAAFVMPARRRRFAGCETREDYWQQKVVAPDSDVGAVGRAPAGGAGRTGRVRRRGVSDSPGSSLIWIEAFGRPHIRKAELPHRARHAYQCPV